MVKEEECDCVSWGCDLRYISEARPQSMAFMNPEDTTEEGVKALVERLNNGEHVPGISDAPMHIGLTHKAVCVCQGCETVLPWDPSDVELLAEQLGHFMAANPDEEEFIVGEENE